MTDPLFVVVWLITRAYGLLRSYTRHPRCLLHCDLCGLCTKNEPDWAIASACFHFLYLVVAVQTTGLFETQLTPTQSPVNRRHTGIENATTMAGGMLPHASVEGGVWSQGVEGVQGLVCDGTRSGVAADVFLFFLWSHL